MIAFKRHWLTTEILTPVSHMTSQRQVIFQPYYNNIKKAQNIKIISSDTIWGIDTKQTYQNLSLACQLRAANTIAKTNPDRGMSEGVRRIAPVESRPPNTPRVRPVPAALLYTPNLDTCCVFTEERDASRIDLGQSVRQNKVKYTKCKILKFKEKLK